MRTSRRGLVERGLSRAVIGAFYDVYNALGFGFLESVYARALERELHARGHQVKREQSVLILYKGSPLARQRLDFLVDAKLVVEIKSTEILSPAGLRQLQNYLRATNLPVGLLLHFGLEPKFYRTVNLKALADEPDGLADHSQ